MSKSGLHRRLLIGSPACSELARAVSELTGFSSEVVVFDERRAFVATSNGGSAPNQPRARWTEEDQVLSGQFGSVSVGDDRSAFAIVDQDQQVVGSLSVNGVVQVNHRAAINAIAGSIGASLVRPLDEDLRTAILDNLRDAILIVGSDMTITWGNAAVASIFGRTTSDVVGMSAADVVHPDDLEKALTAIDRITRGLEIYRVFIRIRSVDGRYTPVEITGFDYTGIEPIDGLLLSLRHAGATEELRALAEKNRHITSAIVSDLRDGVLALDNDDRVIVLNDSARLMFGIPLQTPVSQIDVNCFEGVDQGGHLLKGEALLQPATSSNDDGFECSVMAEGSEVRQVRVDHRTIAGDDSTLGRLVVFSDVTLERRAASELRSQAFHDQLTGLPNRRQMDARLAQLKTSGAEVRVAVSFIDIDGFKLVNDAHGHRYGDEVIRAAASRLSNTMRSSDLLVRQGGDEFVAVHVGVASEKEAFEAAERLRSSLCTTFRAFDETFDLTASVGVAVAEPGQWSPEELVQRADIALYAAKERGRNRVANFSEELADAVRSEERQRRVLRRALDEDRVVMHFQPLIESGSGAVTGYEALARVVMDDGAIVGPAAFMEALASSSLMWELDRRAFSLSCEAASILGRQADVEPAVVACNFSGVSLTQRDFVAFVTNTTERFEVDPGQICIEITESAAFDAGPAALAALSELADAGFGLALDDFGTGYSPLSHLRDLPITSVKVDRSFIANIGTESSERAIAEAVVVLAQQLGLGVVAEGVESAEQREHATDLGFNTLQGWHYSAAMPLGDVMQDWLERQHPADHAGGQTSQM